MASTTGSERRREPVRLVAVDMDGTFLGPTAEYDRVRFGQLYERMRADGIRFVVASGNQYWQLIGYFEGLPDVLYIAENGAIVGTADEVWRILPFDEADASTALKLVDSMPGVLTVACGYRSAYALRASDPGKLERTRPYYPRLELVDGWSEVDEGLVKLALACDLDQTLRIAEHLAAVLPEGIVPTSSGHGSIDLISRGVNKGVSLEWLGTRLGITPAAMVAFGDGGNDVEMLGLVGLAVAMDNAPEQVKAHADVVAGGHHEHGVLEFLEELLDRPTPSADLDPA